MHVDGAGVLEYQQRLRVVRCGGRAGTYRSHTDGIFLGRGYARSAGVSGMRSAGPRARIRTRPPDSDTAYPAPRDVPSLRLDFASLSTTNPDPESSARSGRRVGTAIELKCDGMNDLG